MGIRTQRVARLVQREIAAILSRELPQERMVTVTGVRITNDLSIAYVYVSIFGAAAADRQASFSQLAQHTPRVRGLLGQRVRHQMRSVPEVRFLLDESLQHASQLDSLFESIRKERVERNAS